MSDYAEAVENILGQEFLTWLWCKSDLAPSSFVDLKQEPFKVSMEQRIVVQGGDGDAKETASVVGAFSPLSEARFGLGTGKKVVRALLHLEKGGNSYQLVLKAEDFSLNSVKTPKIEKTNSNDEEDPDALFLEKVYLLETVVELLEALYQTFLAKRLSSAWQEEVAEIRAWLGETA